MQGNVLKTNKCSLQHVYIVLINKIVGDIFAKYKRKKKTSLGYSL